MHPDVVDLLSTWTVALAAVLAAMTLLWLLSLRLRDASIVDIFWGLGFVLVAWTAHLAASTAAWPQQLLLLLVTVWGVRLAVYIGWRNHGQGEDYRYRAMRRRHGAAFAWRSLLRVFCLQGVLIALIAAPLVVALASPRSGGLRWHDWLGLALWALGFFFEAVGDWQLARFKADPANRGAVMRRGLWALTRHPNYFGEAAMWWGYYLLALGVPGGVWTWPAPLVMTLLLLRVSGVALLEKTIVERRPQYRDYIASTSAFIPWFPRRATTEAGR